MAFKDKEQDSEDVVWDEGGGFENLLGFEFGADDGVDRSGLRALINSALVSHRRLPMLDVIFDRAARRMSTSLRQLINDNVEVVLDNVSSTRFGDFIQSQGEAGVIGVMRSQSLDGYAIIAGDPALIHTIVDLLLGGKRGGSAAGEERALTAIELGLAQKIISTLIADLDEAFKPVHDAQFVFDRIETTPRFAAIAQDASVCAIAKFRVAIEDRSARLVILTPHAAIEPIRDLLLRDFFGEAGVARGDWRRQLAESVSTAGVEVSAVLADRTMTIRELQALAVGDTLAFAAQEPKVVLRAGDAVLASGRVGRLGGTIAVRLDAAVARARNEEKAA